MLIIKSYKSVVVQQKYQCQSHHLIVPDFYVVHTSLTLPCISFLLFLSLGFEGTVGAQPLSDLQKRCRCSILHLINGITCTDSLDFISKRIEDIFHCDTCQNGLWLML